MEPFKFFHKNEGPTMEQLLTYNRRLKDAYIFNLSLPEGDNEYRALVFINQTTREFIQGGQLTSYNEIRSYYHVSFENMAVNIYGTVITDLEHESLTREQTMEEQLAEISEFIRDNPNTVRADHIIINPGSGV